MALRDRKEVMNHFFTDPALIQGMDIYIQGEDVKHIKNVLRMKPGEEISVSNGIDDKEYQHGWRCHKQRIEAVPKATMARQDMTRVLDSHSTLDERLDKVAES